MATKLLEKTVSEQDEKKAEKTCVHHWLIEAPEGPVSKGICKKCGEEKEFQNYFPYSSWDNAQTDDETSDFLLSNLND